MNCIRLLHNSNTIMRRSFSISLSVFLSLYISLFRFSLGSSYSFSFSFSCTYIYIFIYIAHEYWSLFHKNKKIKRYNISVDIFLVTFKLRNKSIRLSSLNCFRSIMMYFEKSSYLKKIIKKLKSLNLENIKNYLPNNIRIFKISLRIREI